MTTITHHAENRALHTVRTSRIPHAPHRTCARPGDSRLPGRARLRLVLPLGLALLAAALPVRTAMAQWTSNPSSNTPVADNVHASPGTRALVQSGSGALLAFVTASNQLAVQVLDSAGVRQLGATGAVLDAATVQELAATSDGAGGMIVAYVKGGDVHALLVDGSGTATAGPTPLCTLGGSSGSELAITTDGAGGAVVAWREVQTSVQEQVRMQRIDAIGTALWAANGVVLTTVSAPARAWRVRIASDGAGGAYAGWSRELSVTTPETPMTRRVLAGGTPAWTERPVTIGAPPTERLWLEMCADGSGGALYALYHWPVSGGTRLLVQRVDAAGSQEWPVASGVKSGILACDDSGGMIGIDHHSFDIAADGAGGAVVVTNRSIGFTDQPLIGQRVNGDLATPLLWGGQTAATPVLVSSSHANFHPRLQVGAGHAIVTWTAFADSKNSNTADIHAQRLLLASGSKTWGSGSDLVLSSAVRGQFEPLIVPRTSCSWIVEFVDGRTGAYPPDSYCQVVSHHVTAGGRRAPGPCSGIIWLEAVAVARALRPVLGGKVIVAVDAGPLGFEPHTVDGSGAPAELLLDVRRGPLGSDPADFTRVFTKVGELVFFTADDGVRGRELWCTDGTPQGTRLVVDARPGSAGSSPQDLRAIGKRLFFTADDGEHGRELWCSDGTAAGTALVADLEPGPAGSMPGGLVELEGACLFAATTTKTGRELHRSVGTAAGTALVADLTQGPASSNPVSLTALGGAVYFVASEPASGAELYRTDGTAAGTARVTDLMPGPGSSAPSSLTAAGGQLYFAASDGRSGSELWASDGTAAGTRLVLDVRRGQAGSDPQELVARGAGVLFSADDGVHGREPWISDGTAAGTRLLLDVQQGPGGSDPRGLTTLGSRHSWFSADDGVHGREPWVTDGTAAGTRILGDLREGAAGSDPLGFALCLGLVGLFADDGVARRLVLVDGGATSQAFGCGCQAGQDSRPELGASDPVLGGLLLVSGRNAPAGAVGMTLLGLPATRVLPLGDCDVLLDVLALPPMVMHLGAVPGTEWRFELELPRGEALGGIRVALQTFYASATGIGATDAVELTLGH